MEKKMSETVTGYIDHVIFRNEDNGYTVMVLKGMEEERELIRVWGHFLRSPRGLPLKLPEIIQHIRCMASSFR